MSVNIFQKSTGELKQIAGNAPVGGSGSTSGGANIVWRDRANFPVQGESSVLYIATDENVMYRWNGTLNAYVQLDDTASVKTIVGTV
nr:MAG TPA: Peptidase [Caudoviricetes sp.]